MSSISTTVSPARGVVQLRHVIAHVTRSQVVPLAPAYHIVKEVLRRWMPGCCTHIVIHIIYSIVWVHSSFPSTMSSFER